MPRAHPNFCVLFHYSTRHLLCERNKCDEFTIMHLGFLDYAHYIITVRFHGLEGFHQRYNIKDLKFYVSLTHDMIILDDLTKTDLWINFSVVQNL